MNKDAYRLFPAGDGEADRVNWLMELLFNLHWSPIGWFNFVALELIGWVSVALIDLVVSLNDRFIVGLILTLVLRCKQF